MNYALESFEKFHVYCIIVDRVVFLPIDIITRIVCAYFFDIHKAILMYCIMDSPFLIGQNIRLSLFPDSARFVLIRKLHQDFLNIL